MKKIKKRLKMSKFERLIYTFTLVLVLLTPFALVFSQATLSEVNFEVEKLTKSIDTQEKKNESLTMKRRIFSPGICLPGCFTNVQAMFIPGDICHIYCPICPLPAWHMCVRGCGYVRLRADIWRLVRLILHVCKWHWPWRADGVCSEYVSIKV